MHLEKGSNNTEVKRACNIQSARRTADAVQTNCYKPTFYIGTLNYVTNTFKLGTLVLHIIAFWLVCTTLLHVTFIKNDKYLIKHKISVQAK